MQAKPGFAARHPEQHPETDGIEVELVRYAIVIEKSDPGIGIYVPDLPGCVAAGATEDEVWQLIGEAIEFRLE